MSTNVLEMIWHFNSLNVQIHFLIFFLPFSGLAFLTFRLLWTLKAVMNQKMMIEFLC